jgi:GT2 family glycosyltransferase
MDLKKKITAVIIIYHNNNNLLDNLNNLKDIKTIIVDNGGNNKILGEIKKKNYNNINIISNKKNLGFSKAFNLANEFIKTKYILLLAPDSLIDQNNIKKLSDVLDDDANCIISVPKIYKNNFYKPEDRLLPEKDAIYRNYFETQIKNTLFAANPSGNLCLQCFLGSIMLIRKDYFKNKIFDERYFLYFEDIQLCKNLWNDKKSIILVNDCYAYHEQYGSVKKKNSTLFIINYNFALSKNIYFKNKIFSYIFIKDTLLFLIKTFINLILFKKNKFIKFLSKFVANINFILKKIIL